MLVLRVFHGGCARRNTGSKRSGEHETHGGEICITRGRLCFIFDIVEAII